MSTQNDPPRLLADIANMEGSQSLLRDALAAAKTELPTPERLLALQGKIAIATSTGTAAVGAGATVAKSALWLKIALVAAGALVITATAVVMTSQKHEAPPPPPPPHTLLQHTPITPPFLASATEDASSPTRNTLPLPTSGPVATATPLPTKAPTADLTEETRLLTEAQRALGSNPGEALRLCETHRKTFAAGLLSQERDAVVVEALMKQGRRSEAKRAAAAFARNYPGSSHLRRISDLVGDSAD